jgi:WD40 repeat protein
MNRKTFIQLAISLAIAMGFQGNIVLGELQLLKEKDKAESSEQTTDTITITLKDKTSFTIPEQAATDMSEYFKMHVGGLGEIAGTKEFKFDGKDGAISFDDGTVLFVCKLLSEVYQLKQKNKLDTLFGFIKNKLQDNPNLNLANIWNFASYILCIEPLHNVLAQVLAEYYTSRDFLEKEYKSFLEKHKTGYFDGFHPQGVLLDAIKQCVWKSDPKEYKKVGTLYLNVSAPVHHLALSNDQKTLVAAGGPTIKIIQRDGGGKFKLIQTIVQKKLEQVVVQGNNNVQQNNVDVNALALSQDTLVSGCEDKSIRIYKRQGDDDKYKLSQPIISAHLGKIGVLVLDPNGQMLISSSERDAFINIWYLRDDNGMYEHDQILYLGISNRAEDIVLSNDKQMLVAAVRLVGSNSINMWQHLDRYRPLPSITLHKRCTSLALSIDKQTIFSGLDNGTIEILRRQDDGTYIQYQTLTHGIWAVKTLVLSEDAQVLISRSSDDKTIIWQRQDDGTYIDRQTIENEASTASIVQSIVLSKNKQFFFSGEEKGKITIWRLTSPIDNANFDQTMAYLYTKIVLSPGIKEISQSIKKIVKQQQSSSSSSSGSSSRHHHYKHGHHHYYDERDWHN